MRIWINYIKQENKKLVFEKWPQIHKKTKEDTKMLMRICKYIFQSTKLIAVNHIFVSQCWMSSSSCQQPANEENTHGMEIKRRGEKMRQPKTWLTDQNTRIKTELRIKKKYELQAINHQHNLLTSFDGGDGGDSGDGVKGKALRAKYVRTVPIQHD